jgi:KaiC/GvpD/RAD55 family RecA-like ATPase
MELKRISTGISGLDSILDGGLLPNRSYLITGEAGTGKTTACMQYLMTGLKQGEKAIYVTVDERPSEILHSAASLDWDLQHYVQAKTLVILDASPYFSGRAGSVAEKGGDLQKIVSDLAAYAKRMAAARLVVDPLTPLIISGESPGKIQELARSFIHLIQSNLTTTNLFTAHLPRRSDQDLTYGIEEFLAAGVLVLRVSHIDGRFVRTLQVKKMRGTAVAPAEYPFEISAAKGITLISSDLGAALEVDRSFQALEFFELPKEKDD